MDPSVKVAGVNGWIQSLRAPFVAGAEASVVSPSGAELEEIHQLMGKAQQWEESFKTWGKMAQGSEDRRGWEGLESENGGGDTGKGVGGMVVSIA